MGRLFSVSIVLLLLLISVSSVLGLLDSRCSDNNYVYDQADLIVTGAVSHSKSFLGSEGSIYTVTEISIDNKIKDVQGNSNNRIVVKTQGGEIGDVGQSVEDQPRFTTAEYIKLYLKRNREFQQAAPIVPTYSVVCGENRVDRISSLTSLDITPTIDLSTFAGTEQATNHNLNDNVCCINNEGGCLRNIPSTDTSNYPRCFENEDCYVPECTLGCCETQPTSSIFTCSYITQSACESNRNFILFYPKGHPDVPANTPEDCEAICRGPPTCGNGNCEFGEDSTCPEDCSTTPPTCNPNKLQEIDIKSASGGKFDHIDSMYFNGNTYYFIVGNTYFTLTYNLLERTFQGPFKFSTLLRRNVGGGLSNRFDEDGISEVLVSEKTGLGGPNKGSLFFVIQKNKFVTLTESTRIDRPGLEPFLDTAPEDIGGVNGLLLSMESSIIYNTDERKVPPTPFYKVDAALLYNHKYYFVDGNRVYIYTPGGYTGSRTIWSGEEARLSDLIPGCHSIDSAMYDGNNIYFSKGGKAWVMPTGSTRIIEKQRVENLPKVESLNLDFKDGQALCGVKGTADSNTQLLVQFRYLVNGKVASSFGSPIAAEFFREGLIANYEPINNLINEFNQGNIFSGVNPEIDFNGIKIKDELSIECDAIPYRINDDGTIRIDDAVTRVKATPLVFRRNAVARFFANIFRRGSGAP